MSKALSDLDVSEDDAYSKKALSWFLTLSDDGQTCPVCGAEFFDGTEAEKKRNLTAHGKAKHMSRIALGFPSRNIDAMGNVEDEAESVLEAAGLETLATLDKYDALAVPRDIKKSATRDGASVRWVAGNNVERFKNHGMEVVKGDSGEPVQSGGLTLFRIPNRLRNQYATQRAQRSQNGPAARKEDLERNIEGHSRKMYDAALKKGLGKDVARNLANAAERGLATGVLNIRRG